MNRVLEAVRRHLPGGRSRAVQAAFAHGYHAAHHDAANLDGCDERCASILSTRPT